MIHQIVVLDGYTLNPGDLSWDKLKAIAPTKIYDRTKPDELIERAKNASIIVSNKVIINEKILEQLSQLKCICVSATGYNVIDVEAAKAKGIPVCNVVGYGSTSVAQHVFALILAFTNKVHTHSDSVHSGDWSKAIDWSYWKSPIIELSAKTMGIYGLGKIGSQVAKIALAFGMKVLATHKHPQRDQMNGVKFVDFKTLCTQSDFISLHAPLNNDNQGIIHKAHLALMKKSCFLVNTGRGGLIVEQDLKEALEKGTIAGAGLDVLSTEPPDKNNVLLGAKNCIITPHHAWASRESRQRLYDVIIDNIKSFIAGHPKNVVNEVV